MLATFSNMLRDEEGATLVEYALIVALIAVVAIAAISLLGKNASSTLNTAATSV
ncbi:MAG: Flp family type IVb pilin [Vulcanimicrobiaceae bacterium]